jgi:DNA-binding transcriptional MerR regulator
MPVKDKELEKVYFGIGEVAQMLNVNPSLIRFWEKQFPGITPTKNKKGDRLFTKKEIEKLKEIHKLVKDKGFKLAGAKKQLRSKEVIPTELYSSLDLDKAKAILLAARKKLLDLKASLD